MVLLYVIMIYLNVLCVGVEGLHGNSGSRLSQVTLTREFVLSLRMAKGEVPTNIPEELHVQRCPDHKPSRRQRGKRGRIRRRLKTMSLDNQRRLPPLLTVLLSNVQSIRNKINNTGSMG